MNLPGNSDDLNNEYGAANEDDYGESGYTIQNVQHSLGLHFLKLQEKQLLPASTVQLVVEQCTALHAMNQEENNSLVKKILEKYNVDAAVQEELCHSLANSAFHSALLSLKTDCKRNRFYKDNFGLVDSVPMTYTSDVGKDSFFHYVSMIEMLKVLLKNESVLTQVMTPKQTRSNIISDFRDSTSFKSNPVFQRYGYCLEIIVYSDEFVLVNPIGAHRKKHKILAFYYTLGNLNRGSRSKCPTIQLLCLCKASDVNEFGLDAVARCLNEELSVLENEGIDVGLPNKLHGALVAICGDNLNSHCIGGFNESFGPNVFRPCRFCMVTRDNVKTCTEVSKLQCRTEQSYRHHVSVVKADERQSLLYGVKRDSPFNHGSFHVTKGLPPDIMHDLLEGVAPYEIALVLHKLIDCDLICLAHLNILIRSWNYGPLDALDKPCQIPDGFQDKICQNAARTWCFLRLLPLMLGRLMQGDNIYVQFLVDLKDIMDMSFSFSLSTPDISLLQMKIQDHLESFKILFPAKTLLPKHHFLLHYGQQFLMFGPLRLYWCMRFEAKHAYFKRVVKVANNFKNVLLTLSSRHQRYQSYLSAAESGHVRYETKMSKTNEVNVTTLIQETKALFASHAVNLDRSLHECRFVTINGITYHVNMIIVVKCDSEGVHFGQVSTIYIYDMEPFFFLRLCKSYYDGHYGGYCLQLTGQFVLLRCAQFGDYYPFESAPCQGEKVCCIEELYFQ